MSRFLIAALLALVMVVPPTAWASECSHSSIGLTPLMDLGTGTYQGEQGGLYPGGSNTPPADYMAAGVAAGQSLIGLPKIGLLAIGMSNTDLFFTRFQELATDRNPTVTLIDGAIWGADVTAWTSPTAKAWRSSKSKVSAAGLAATDVRAIWLMEAPSSQLSTFPLGARSLAGKLSQVIDAARVNYPNVAQVHVSDLAYERYAGSAYDPRHGFETGYAVKWLIADRIAANVTQPWVGWSADIWADGINARSDGLTWLCSDFQGDGLHPASTGRDKGAERVLAAYQSDPTTVWFRR